MGKFKKGDSVFLRAKIVREDKADGEYLAVLEAYGLSLYLDEHSIYPIKHVDESEKGKNYDDGLREAWGLAKKIICNIEYGGLHTSELEQIFGYAEFDDVLKNYTPQEAAAKIAEWEDGREIRFRDEVIYGGNGNRRGVVTKEHTGFSDDECCVLWSDGGVGTPLKSRLTKTGRHIDIAGLLAEIGGA